MDSSLSTASYTCKLCNDEYLKWSWLVTPHYLYILINAMNRSDKAPFIYYPLIRCPFRIVDDVGANSLNIYDCEKIVFFVRCSIGQNTSIMYCSIVSLLDLKLPFQSFKLARQAVTDNVNDKRSHSKTNQNYVDTKLNKHFVGQHTNWCHWIIYHICILPLYFFRFVWNLFEIWCTL